MEERNRAAACSGQPPHEDQPTETSIYEVETYQEFVREVFDTEEFSEMLFIFNIPFRMDEDQTYFKVRDLTFYPGKGLIVRDGQVLEQKGIDGMLELLGHTRDEIPPGADLSGLQPFGLGAKKD
ncbi:hypothetical protein ACI7BZ_03195 [Xanthobacter sp. AM11]|uniref:hypothetical protein n=1 Tax=Xanthobacter sp. AM11 TaxID=3380643 RepID=UPI0039BED39F